MIKFFSQVDDDELWDVEDDDDDAAPTRQFHRLSLARDKIVFVDSKEGFDAFVEEISKAVITIIVGKTVA